MTDEWLVTTTTTTYLPTRNPGTGQESVNEAKIVKQNCHTTYWLRLASICSHQMKRNVCGTRSAEGKLHKTAVKRHFSAINWNLCGQGNSSEGERGNFIWSLLMTFRSSFGCLVCNGTTSAAVQGLFIASPVLNQSIYVLFDTGAMCN